MHGDVVALVGQLVHLQEDTFDGLPWIEKRSSFTHHGVVCVLVRDVECGVDGAAVGVLPAGLEELVLVELPVLIVDCVVEGDGDHLGDVAGHQTAGDQGAVGRAEAVGKRALNRELGTVKIILCWMISEKRITPKSESESRNS